MCFGAIASAASSRSRDPEVRTTGSPTGTQTRGSSPRPKPKPSPISRTISNVSRSVVNDVAMGLSTFGQSKEKQRETLRSKGYSESVIDDYQARTAASAARAAQQNMRTEYGNDDNRPAPAPTPPPAPVVTAPTPTPPPAPTPTPPPAPTPPTPIVSAPVTTTATSAPVTPGGEPEPVTVGQTSAASGEMDAAAIEAVAEGPAEAKVAETARKGRRATIQTGPQGLLTTAKTRRRRSLMGGEEPRGLIS